MFFQIHYHLRVSGVTPDNVTVDYVQPMARDRG